MVAFADVPGVNLDNQRKGFWGLLQGWDRFDLIGINPPGHATLLVAERSLAVGAFFIGLVGLCLHGFLHEQPLKLQARLARVLLDETQALLGMLLDLLQALAQVLPPAGDVLFEQMVLTVGEDFIDQGFE